MTLHTVTYNTATHKIVPLEPTEKQLDVFEDWCAARKLTMPWEILAIVLKRLIAAAPEYQDTCTDGGKCGAGGYCNDCGKEPVTPSYTKVGSQYLNPLDGRWYDSDGLADNEPESETVRHLYVKEDIPQHVANDDGFCEWVTPNHEHYEMYCCDCGLGHVLQFEIWRFEDSESTVAEEIKDENICVAFRAKRIDKDE